MLYVSNINGSPTEKDGNGFISKIDADGKVIALKWAVGLNAPKGAAVWQHKLYVSDIDQLVVINAESGAIINRYGAPEAQFLNDVAVDETGNVYISDSSGSNSVIYRFREGVIEVWVKDEAIQGPNGLFADKDGLLVGSSGDGRIKCIRYADRKIELVYETGSGIDGLKTDGEGLMIFSDWWGTTSCVDALGTRVVLLNTTDDGINAADIEFIPEEKKVLIPTFSDNRIMAYRLILK